MSAKAPVHPEVLLSLADEIRQTIAWLGDQEDPSADQVAPRIRTLREAATVAGLESVGSILTDLGKELAGSKKKHVKIELVLERLSSAILTMADSLENKQLEWIDRALGIEQTLDRVASELAQGTDRLAGSASLLEACSVARSDEDRRHLLLKLAEDVRKEISRQRHLCDRLHESVAALRTGTRRLTGDLSGLLTVPLLPTLIRLSEQLRVLGRDLGKPVSLHPRCTGVEVSARQIEPLGRVLDHLVKEAFQEGIEKPQQRRAGGKPTVGVLRVTATGGKGLLRIAIQDDGRSERPEAKLPRAVTKDLKSLRARLLKEPPADGGRCLTLEVPVWHSTLEVISVGLPGGEVLLPVSVVGEVFSGGKPPPDSLPVVWLERRAPDARGKRPESGVIFEIEGWRGVMYTELLNTHFRVIPSPPEAGDPPWVIGRVRSRGASPDASEGKPVVHPLVFMELKEEQVCLFPPVEE